jgi:hypothetical protein
VPVELQHVAVINQFVLPCLPRRECWRGGHRSRFGCDSAQSHSILTWPFLQAR